MSKRTIKGLPSTGRVSMARARAAVREIKGAIGKGGVTRDAEVTSASTATGRHLVAFRVTSKSASVARAPGKSR